MYRLAYEAAAGAGDETTAAQALVRALAIGVSAGLNVTDWPTPVMNDASTSAWYAAARADQCFALGDSRTGLAYCAVSERAWKRMETAKSPRYYFDFRKERKAAAKGESSYTPATSLFAALGAALDFIRQMGNGDLVAGGIAEHELEGFFKVLGVAIDPLAVVAALGDGVELWGR